MIICILFKIDYLGRASLTCLGTKDYNIQYFFGKEASAGGS